MGLWLLAAMLFLYNSVECGVWNWMPRHLIAEGVSESRALNILSLGFALGITLGRVAVAPVLGSVTPEMVTPGAAIGMFITLLVASRSRGATVAGIAVFCAGLAMAPAFPTVNARRTLSATGLAVRSGMIGAMAGGDPKRLKRALMILSSFSMLIAGNTGSDWLPELSSGTIEPQHRMLPYCNFRAVRGRFVWLGQRVRMKYDASCWGFLGNRHVCHCAFSGIFQAATD